MTCPHCQTDFEHLCVTLAGTAVYWCPSCGTIGGPDVKRVRTPLRVHMLLPREAEPLTPARVVEILACPENDKAHTGRAYSWWTSNDSTIDPSVRVTVHKETLVTTIDVEGSEETMELKIRPVATADQFRMLCWLLGIPTDTKPGKP